MSWFRQQIENIGGSIQAVIDNPIINPVGFVTSAPLGLTASESYTIGAVGGSIAVAAPVIAGAWSGLTIAGAKAAAVPIIANAAKNSVEKALQPPEVAPAPANRPITEALRPKSEGLLIPGVIAALGIISALA